MSGSEIAELVSFAVDACITLKEYFVNAKEQREWDKNPHPINPHMGPKGAALFEWNAKSPRTERNLLFRRMKGIASAASSIVGSGIALGTQTVNPMDIAKHGVSGTTTAVHLYRFRQLARKVQDGGSLRRHIDLLVELKAVKLGSRGAQLAIAATPGVSGLGLVGTAIGLAHEQLYIRVRKERIMATALALHWQAYRELKLLGAQAKTGYGPALRLVRELMGLGLDVGPMKLHSVEEINALMREPAGYEVIKTKLEQT